MAIERRVLGAAWFEPFGFARGLVDPESGEQAELFRDGLALVGARDGVRQLAELRARLPVRWIFCWMYNGLVPHRVLLDTIERFWARGAAERVSASDGWKS